MTEDCLNLRAFLDVLIHRWMFVVAMPVIAVAAAAVISLTIKPSYEATAVIALSPATLSVPTTGQAPPYYLMVNAPSQLPAAHTPAYYMALLNGADVAAAAAQVPVSITSDGSDKSLIDITARGGDPTLVAFTANDLMRAGVARIQATLLPNANELKAASATLGEAEQSLVKFSQDNDFEDFDLGRLRSATFSSTDKQLQLTGLLRAYDTAESVYLDFAKEAERANILAVSAYAPTGIPAAVPTTPVSPKLAQNVLAGAVLGLLLGVLSAFAVDYASRREHGHPSAPEAP